MTPVETTGSRVMPSPAARRDAVSSCVASTRLLLAVYRDPAAVSRLEPAQWSHLLGAARRARCLGHLALRLTQAGVLDRVDARVLGHFESASHVIARQRRALRWELRELALALADVPGPVVALKGAAYELAGLPLASARLAADIDLLVPKASLTAVEARLRALDWESVPLNDHDERYYREWSHEIPALHHPERGLEVDVHHSIAPGLPGDGTAAGRLIADRRSLRGEGVLPEAVLARFDVLQPVDQLLHVALHTFAGSELAMRLREVMDLDLLVRHWCVERDATDVTAVLARAESFGQERPVWWAMHFAARWLGTPMPEHALRSAGRPPSWMIAAMNPIVDRSMLPGERVRRTHREFAAELAMLVRYQWQRLPLRRLVPHVFEKARRRLWDREA